MGPHRGSQDDLATGDKKKLGLKKDNYKLKKWNQKFHLGDDIKQKETLMGPHRRSQKDPASGDKKQKGVKKGGLQAKKMESKNFF